MDNQTIETAISALIARNMDLSDNIAKIQNSDKLVLDLAHKMRDNKKAIDKLYEFKLASQ